MPNRIKVLTLFTIVICLVNSNLKENIFDVFIDVISIQKTSEHFRLIYDVKGRFTIHRITPEEAKVI